MARAPKLWQIILLIFPVITVLWGLILNHLSGPHFLSRSDPEYVYLLNGMNAALLKFDRIGHVDHPGTPFQLITGLFIRIIYWVSGEGKLVEDVITQPEKYLFWSSFFLSIITAYLFFRISILEYKRSNNLFSALIIPLSFSLFYVVVDLPSRYIPDRLLLMILLVFTGLTLNYLYDGISKKRYALLSGIVMALGVVTKINFLPFLILPVVIIDGWKGKIRYAVSAAIACVLLFLPVYDKFSQFWRFAVQISTHEGLYGSGNQQVLNTGVFLKNLGLILQDNPLFILVTVLAIIVVISVVIKRGLLKKHRKELLVLLGFLLVAAASLVMVAKHYKNYYMIPILSMNGLVLYLVWRIIETSRLARFYPYVLSTGFVVLFIHVLLILGPGLQWRVFTKHQNLQARDFIDKQVSVKDLLLIEPTWMGGPMKENGLVYGISYVGHRHYFYNDYERVYPHVITYEGPDKPFRYFRELDADDGGILRSGRDIYMLSSPGRNTLQLVNMLHEKASLLSISMEVDTVYYNENVNYYLLKMNNTSGWKQVKQAVFGFEQEIKGQLHSNDGLEHLSGTDYQLSDQKSANGLYALRLDKLTNTSPAYHLHGVEKGDYVQASIKRRRKNDPNPGILVIRYADAQTGETISHVEQEGDRIHPHWEIIRVNFLIAGQPKDGVVSIFYTYSGSSSENLDDFEITHYAQENVHVATIENKADGIQQ